MDRKYLAIISGVIAVLVGFLSFNSYMSTTSAAVTTGSVGSLTVAVISLLIACGLFAKYFGLIK
jgi:hypothetical protein